MIKLFLAWSGDKGRLVAEALVKWLPEVIPDVKPWMSDRNIVDTVWFNEIVTAINEAKAGIVCLTRENFDRPWILFEAGGLMVNCDKTAVFNLLLDVKAEELDGLNYPLFPCELYSFQKERVLSILKALNEMSDPSQRLKPEEVKKRFETHWKELESELNAISQNIPFPMHLLNEKRYRVQMTKRWKEIYLTFVAKHIAQSPFQFKDLIEDTKSRILISGQNLYFLAGEEDSDKEEQRKDWILKALKDGKQVDIMLCNPSWRYAHAVKTWGHDVMNDRKEYKRHLKYSIKTFRKWLLDIEKDNEIDAKKLRIKKVGFVPLSITFVDPVDEDRGKLAITTATYDRPENRLRSCYLILRKEHPDIFKYYWEGYRGVFEHPKTPTV